MDSNHEVERVFGWTREELLGREAGHFLAPEWRELAQLTLQKCQRGEPVRNVEFAVRTKNGVVVPVLATAFLLTDELGEPVAIANILKDITQLKQATERLQQRNEQLQQFANVLAHDLSAPLQTIRSFAELLEEECSDECSDDFREYLQRIVSGAARMDAMISDLLHYMRLEHQEMAFDAVDSQQALADALANLHSTIQEAGAEVTYDPLPTVHGERTSARARFSEPDRQRDQVLPRRTAAGPRLRRADRPGMAVLRARQRDRHGSRGPEKDLRRLPATARPRSCFPARGLAWRSARRSSSVMEGGFGSNRKKASAACFTSRFHAAPRSEALALHAGSHEL